MTTFQGAYSQRNRYGNYAAAGGTKYYTIRAVANNTTMGSVSVQPAPVTVSVGVVASDTDRRYAKYTDSPSGSNAAGLTSSKITGSNPTVTGYKDGQSMHIAAVAKKGYRFVEWRGLPERLSSQRSVAVLSFLAREDLSLTAVFSVAPPSQNDPTQHEEPVYVITDPEPPILDEIPPEDRPGLIDIPTDIPGGGSGGGETPSAQEPQAAQGTGILALARRYWWIIAAVLVYLITRNE